MKKSILFSLPLIMIISGCGVLDKKNINDTRLLDDSEKVVYVSQGKYDLTNYLFPNTNQTYIYQRAKYKDNQGDKNFNSEPISFNDSEVVEYVIDNNTISEGDSTKYTIPDDNVSLLKQELVNDFYDIRKYRRYVDIGDYYFSYEHVDADSTLYQIGWMKCQVKEHNNTISISVLDNNKTYSDVLLLGCESESANGVRGEFSEEKTFRTELYFAKNIGEIAAVGEE
ncbi:MAG TPA: hypothetical protein ENK88_00610, partial [Campylobacterales bacterium]|nr:hypothetical protein [Campylobacterales bacterium]